MEKLFVIQFNKGIPDKIKEDILKKYKHLINEDIVKAIGDDEEAKKCVEEVKKKREEKRLNSKTYNIQEYRKNYNKKIPMIYCEYCKRSYRKGNYNIHHVISNKHLANVKKSEMSQVKK